MTIYTKLERENFERYPNMVGVHKPEECKRRLGMIVPQRKNRKCLRCEKEIISEGPQHRMCFNCRQRNGIHE